jgi:predicted metal-dependent phosphoesterase TrpH
LDYNQHVGIDLHIHTTASDGTLTPSEIVAHAIKLKLKAIAITDHDTLVGSREALNSGIPADLEFLTGVEISAAPPAFYHHAGSFHLLGYSIRLDDSNLNQTLEKLQVARKNRNPAIIKRLNELGISINLGEVCELAGDAQLGRPHIAQMMISKGVVSSINEAFDQFLGTDKPAYVDKYRVECSQAIEAILGAGGIPVLAHPGLLQCEGDKQLDELIGQLKRMGIQGVEVYYSGHTADQTHLFSKLAQRHDLLMTGGTDFHGSIHPDIQMGSGKGNLSVSYELYKKLIQYKKRTSNIER